MRMCTLSHAHSHLHYRRLLHGSDRVATRRELSDARPSCLGGLQLSLRALLLCLGHFVLPPLRADEASRCLGSCGLPARAASLLLQLKLGRRLLAVRSRRSHGARRLEMPAQFPEHREQKVIGARVPVDCLEVRAVLACLVGVGPEQGNEGVRFTAESALVRPGELVGCLWLLGLGLCIRHGS